MIQIWLSHSSWDSQPESDNGLQHRPMRAAFTAHARQCQTFETSLGSCIPCVCQSLVVTSKVVNLCENQERSTCFLAASDYRSVLGLFDLLRKTQNHPQSCACDCCWIVSCTERISGGMFHQEVEINALPNHFSWGRMARARTRSSHPLVRFFVPNSFSWGLVIAMLTKSHWS